MTDPTHLQDAWIDQCIWRQSWGLGVGGHEGCGRVVKYYCTENMFESGDFSREIEQFAQF